MNANEKEMIKIHLNYDELKLYMKKDKNKRVLTHSDLLNISINDDDTELCFFSPCDSEENEYDETRTYLVGDRIGKVKLTGFDTPEPMVRFCDCVFPLWKKFTMIPVYDQDWKPKETEQIWYVKNFASVTRHETFNDKMLEDGSVFPTKKDAVKKIYEMGWSQINYPYKGKYFAIQPDFSIEEMNGDYYAKEREECEVYQSLNEAIIRRDYLSKLLKKDFVEKKDVAEKKEEQPVMVLCDCPSCKGSKKTISSAVWDGSQCKKEFDECSKCGGSGKVLFPSTKFNCEGCNGTGMIGNKKCPHCYGSGIYYVVQVEEQMKTQTGKRVYIHERERNE